MAKKMERSTARKFFVELGYTAKEISARLNVSEQTVSKWVNDKQENWRDQRNARLVKTEVRTDNIKQVINSLCEDRLGLDRSLKDAMRNDDTAGISQCRKEMARIDDSISKWNKTLTTLDKENKVPLNVYVLVMDAVFTALGQVNEKLYLQTIDFQEQHLNEVASRYK